MRRPPPAGTPRAGVRRRAFRTRARRHHSLFPDSSSARRPGGRVANGAPRASSPGGPSWDDGSDRRAACRRHTSPRPRACLQGATRRSPSASSAPCCVP
jgi:hypothetical protein